MELKIILLTEVTFMEFILDLDKYIFPWQTFFLGGGGSSLITVILHLGI